MNKIIFPLKPRMKGKKVSDLQDVLLYLLEHRPDLLAPRPVTTHVPHPPDWKKIESGLKRESKRNYFGKTTTWLVANLQYHLGLPSTGIVDEATAKAINALLKKLGLLNDDEEGKRKFLVCGTIQSDHGIPASNLLIRAFDRDLRSEQFLGETTTDQAGYYEIRYTPDQFARAEKASADLVVRVFDAQGKILTQSDICFNAGAKEEINLVLGSGVIQEPSEYEQLVAELTPLLNDVDFAELEESDEHHDISFLSGETSQDPQRIQALATAHRFEHQARDLIGEDTGDAFSLTAPVFYGLFRENMPTDFQALLQQDFYILRKALEKALEKNIIPQEISARLDSIIDNFNLLADENGIEKPSHYIDVQQKRLQAIGELVGLDAAIINHLTNRAVTFPGVNDTTLGELVKTGVFKQQQAKEVGLAVSLYHLLDSNMQLLETIKTGTFQQLSQGKINEIKDLVAFDASDWLAILQGLDEFTPPENFTLEEYATFLAKKIEKLYPSHTLLARLIRAENLTVRFKASDTELLHPLINTYKGLKLSEITGNKEISDEEKAARVHERISLLATFQAQNPDAEILALDYSPESEDIAALVFDGSDEEKQMLLSCFKAYQRVYAVCEDVEHCQTLMAAGYDSAIKIVSDSEEDFRTRSRLSAGTSHSIYMASLDSAGSAATLVGSVVDVIKGGFGWLDVANQCSEVGNYLKKIEGFEALFGSQDYCRCRHCQSILSPAAYFVDLMSFVEKNIIDVNFPGDLQNHVLNLRTRRRDLWELQLSCENTHGLIPYLDIINEVLENYIYVAEHGGTDENLPPRSSIERYVYHEKISSENVHSLLQPRLLPLHKLETYLSHFDITRGAIAELLEKPVAVIAAAELHLSSAEYDLIIHSDTSLFFLRTLYGIYFVVDAETGIVNKFDAQQLLHSMALSRDELGELIKTKYIRYSSSETIRIRGEKRDEGSVQEDIEYITGLTPSSLDRMHRFVRLWRQLPWSITELDLVLAHLDNEDTDIHASVLSALVKLVKLQDRFAISVEEMCCLWSLIPRVLVSGQEEPLFDRLFNLPEFVLYDGNYPKPNILFIHPALAENGENQNPDPHRLLAGLRIDDEQLYQLIIHLREPLGLNLDDPGGDEYQPGFALSLKNLSLLYRHSRLTQWLKVTIDQLFQLISQNPSNEPGYIGDLNTLNDFLQYHDWWDTADYSCNDISYLLGRPVADDAGYSKPGELATQVLDDIHEDQALTFADTVFAYLETVTEEESKIITETNSGWIMPVPDSDRYWLSDSFKADTLKDNPREALTFSLSIFSRLDGVTNEQSLEIIAANPALIDQIEISNPHGRTSTVGILSEHFTPESLVNIPEGIGIKPGEALSLLLAYYHVQETVYPLLVKYHVSEVLPLYLGRRLDFSIEKTKSLIQLTGLDLNDPRFITALHNTETVDPVIADLAEKLLRLSVLFKENYFDAVALKFVDEENETVFAGIDFETLKTENIQAISLYKRFQSELAETASLKDLHAVLTETDTDDNAALGQVLQIETSLAGTMLQKLPLPASPLEKLEKLQRYVEIITYLGIAPEALTLIASEDYDELGQAVDAVVAAFRAKYGDEKEWLKKVEPYREKIRTFKRDVLTDYLVHSPEHNWCTSDKDIYYYFLLDVELEGCARTSRLVAAISSVQLYVHRILMNLEQSGDGDIQVAPARPDDFIQEWGWRKNYRVWEANRKVFLYPENWIEPELRDNKTPLFEALESELLQQEIDEQTVLDAYANYMRGFEELAHLKIAGSFHEINDGNATDTLHLFGVTSDEPPIYYYRGIENAHYRERNKGRGIIWHPWQKVDVQIPVSKVAPIVFRGRLYVFWVEITTRPKNEVKDGSSEFVGYQHKMSLKYTSLRLDGTWTTPQRISLYGVAPFDKGDGVIEDPLIDPNDDLTLSHAVQECQQYFESKQYSKFWNCFSNILSRYHHTPKYDNHVHLEPEDGYTLTGYRWDQVYPEVYTDEQGIEHLKITGRDWELIAAPVDLYDRSVKTGRKKIFIPTNKYQLLTKLLYSFEDTDSLDRIICSFMPDSTYHVDYLYASIWEDKERLVYLEKRLPESFISLFQNITSVQPMGSLEKIDYLSVINGSIHDAILDSNGDLLLLQSLERDSHTHLLKRLGTTISEQVAKNLLTRGVDGLLDINTQKNLVENPSPISKTDDYIDDSHITRAIDAGHPDFKGAFGTYYREIFFHIPFLIANHLNSQQKFRQAQKWYQYIFDPTAGKEDNSQEDDYTPTPVGQRCKENDRVWRYIEFRNLDIESLREKLTDPDTLEAYRKDPFNPHAIARLRLTAYQKTIVMKYIDNLLDWGDQLFGQDTMESINEASLLYILAADILGERPAELGECSEIPESSRNYESIKEVMHEDSPFLLEMEHYVVIGHLFNYSSPANSMVYTLDPSTANHAVNEAYASLATDTPTANQPMAETHSAAAVSAIAKYDNVSVMVVPDVGLSKNMNWNQARFQMHPQYNPRGWLDVIRQISPVFCVPENKELKQYWDRVEDRLYKIRNCMNISGVRRELSLFAPEIDPGLLVRAKAGGLSVEDVLNAISGNLPPYRFSYTIEKAKGYAATLQGFGSALLSALEKKDVEELTLLRTVHEQNIMKLTRQVKQWEIDAANENVAGLQRRRDTVQHRRDYYQSLLEEGLSDWERTQQVSKHSSSAIRGTQASLGLLASVTHLIPQAGSPFAMKYGGKEAGDALDSGLKASEALASLADNIAASAGLEAMHQRREQGWKFQLEQADHELKELEKQIKATKIQKELAERSLEIHEKSLEQLDEVYEFYGEKFSNLGLYTWLSTTLQRLYREAYNSAFAMAKLAEQSYRFERSDDTSELLGSGYWESPRAGLLAGERLMLDLQNLERKYIETNYRDLEINQTFSLSQIAPDALLTLKETGSCEFDIAEIFFDLFYPGHYRRKIKAVRVSIPCVTGPYTNISATLALTDSSIRMEPNTDSEALKPVPRTRTLSIATSSAQNDAGVFELNFRDERYMPFEGAGAISSWKLTLPATFRQFDYDTISDILVHLSYTAEEDGALREQIEDINEGIEGSLLKYLQVNPLQRVFSFQHDFSDAFHRLVQSTSGQAVSIHLQNIHFPFFLSGKNLQVDNAKLYLKPKPEQSITGLTVTVDGTQLSPEDSPESTSAFDVTLVFSNRLFSEHTFLIKDTGSEPPENGTNIDKIEDILLSLSYRLSP